MRRSASSLLLIEGNDKVLFSNEEKFDALHKIARKKESDTH
jgi:hypothetical protein